MCTFKSVHDETEESSISGEQIKPVFDAGAKASHGLGRSLQEFLCQNRNKNDPSPSQRLFCAVRTVDEFPPSDVAREEYLYNIAELSIFRVQQHIVAAERFVASRIRHCWNVLEQKEFAV